MTKTMFEDADLWMSANAKWRIVTLKRRPFISANFETVHLPHDLMGMVEGRSSWARMGVGVM